MWCHGGVVRPQRQRGQRALVAFLRIVMVGEADYGGSPVAAVALVRHVTHGTLREDMVG
jgi:hypothetical protein